MFHDWDEAVNWDGDEDWDNWDNEPVTDYLKYEFGDPSTMDELIESVESYLRLCYARKICGYEITEHDGPWIAYNKTNSDDTSEVQKCYDKLSVTMDTQITTDKQ